MTWVTLISWFLFNYMKKIGCRETSFLLQKKDHNNFLKKLGGMKLNKKNGQNQTTWIKLNLAW